MPKIKNHISFDGSVQPIKMLKQVGV